MFDHPDTISLDDLTPQETANRLGRPVALADTMGDVWDVLTGDSLVMFRPENKQSGTQQQDPGIMQPPEDG
jgi:hypothetical protein